MKKPIASEENNNKEEMTQQDKALNLLVTEGENINVEWDPEAKVTKMGSLVYFGQYLKAGGLMERLCKGVPLFYTSNNAPDPRDVLGTIVFSTLSGQTRFSHMNALRGDLVGAEMLGFSKIVSEDSVRRALKRGTEESWNSWLTIQERATYEPLLTEKYIVDIDNTVKPIYGHQEGAELGYNPQKPGRPSHNFHTYFIGSLRIVLGVDVLPGKQHSGKHSFTGLWKLIDSLPAQCRPYLIRGDVSYGNESGMAEAETRNQFYLFKLRQTTKVRSLILELERKGDLWLDAGEGWQGTEQKIKLMGWSQARRCIVLRRPASTTPAQKLLPKNTEQEFSFISHLNKSQSYEYIVLVTNSDLSVRALSQLYRDRADCENVFDEIKNQWGWAGFVTHDLRRSHIIARMIALVYNWWNIFTRLATPEKHMEAVTSRPLLLHAVGRVVKTARQKTIHLTSSHAKSDQIQFILNKIGTFLNAVVSTAEQLTVEAIWATILSAAFIKWLRGKLLYPVSHSDQMLLQLRI